MSRDFEYSTGGGGGACCSVARELSRSACSRMRAGPWEGGALIETGRQQAGRQAGRDEGRGICYPVHLSPAHH